MTTNSLYLSRMKNQRGHYHRCAGCRRVEQGFNVKNTHIQEFFQKSKRENQEKETKTKQNHIRSSRSSLQVLPTVSSRPGALLPCLQSPSCFRQPRFPRDCSHSPPHFLCLALPTQCCLILVPPDEAFGCFEDPLVPLARLLCCNLPRLGLNSKHQRRVFRRPLGGSKHF